VRRINNLRSNRARKKSLQDTGRSPDAGKTRKQPKNFPAPREKDSPSNFPRRGGDHEENLAEEVLKKKGAKAKKGRD